MGQVDWCPPLPPHLQSAPQRPEAGNVGRLLLRPMALSDENRPRRVQTPLGARACTTVVLLLLALVLLLLAGAFVIHTTHNESRPNDGLSVAAPDYSPATPRDSAPHGNRQVNNVAGNASASQAAVSDANKTDASAVAGNSGGINGRSMNGTDDASSDTMSSSGRTSTLWFGGMLLLFVAFMILLCRTAASQRVQICQLQSELTFIELQRNSGTTTPVVLRLSGPLGRAPRPSHDVQAVIQVFGEPPRYQDWTVDSAAPLPACGVAPPDYQPAGGLGGPRHHPSSSVVAPAAPSTAQWPHSGLTVTAGGSARLAPQAGDSTTSVLRAQVRRPAAAAQCTTVGVTSPLVQFARPRTVSETRYEALANTTLSPRPPSRRIEHPRR